MNARRGWLRIEPSIRLLGCAGHNAIWIVRQDVSAVQRDDHRPLGGVCLPKRKMDDLSPMRGNRHRHREGDEKFVYPRAGGDNDHIDRDMAAVKHDAGDSVVVYGKCRVAGDTDAP